MPRPYSQQGSQAAAATASTGMTKTTCEACKQHVLIATVDKAHVVTDSELITVITDNPRDRTRRERVSGRRLHADSCERMKRAAEKERIRDEMREWTLEQKQRLAPVASQRAARKFKRTRGL